jgi:flagellar protein FliO/FliZ
MSIYLNAFVALLATITAFVVLAKLVQAIRLRRVALPWRISGLGGPVATQTRLAVEQTCMVDSKRRLLLVRCDEQRVLLLTGGPADLVVSVLPAPHNVDAGA